MTRNLAAEREAAAEKIARLEEQRAALEDAIPTRAAEMDKIAYSALAENEPKAKRRLQELHDENARVASELTANRSALTEAQKRAAAVEAEIERVWGVKNARAVMELADKFVDAGERAQRAAEELGQAVMEMVAVHHEVVALGCAHPAMAVFSPLSKRALSWALHRTPAQPEPVTQITKTSFEQLGAEFRGSWLLWVRARLTALGEPLQDELADAAE